MDERIDEERLAVRAWRQSRQVGKALAGRRYVVNCRLRIHRLDRPDWVVERSADAAQPTIITLTGEEELEMRYLLAIGALVPAPEEVSPAGEGGEAPPAAAEEVRDGEGSRVVR